MTHERRKDGQLRSLVDSGAISRGSARDERRTDIGLRAHTSVIGAAIRSGSISASKGAVELRNAGVPVEGVIRAMHAGAAA